MENVVLIPRVDPALIPHADPLALAKMPPRVDPALIPKAVVSAPVIPAATSATAVPAVTTSAHHAAGGIVVTSAHHAAGGMVVASEPPNIPEPAPIAPVPVAQTQPVAPFQPGTEPFREIAPAPMRQRRVCDSFGRCTDPTFQAGPYYSDGATSMLSLPGNFWQGDFGRMLLSDTMNRAGGYAGLAAQQNAQMVNAVADMRNSVEWRNAWHRAREEGATAEAAVGIADNRVGMVNPDYVSAYATLLAPTADAARAQYAQDAYAQGAVLGDVGLGNNARLTTGQLPGAVQGVRQTEAGTVVDFGLGAGTEPASFLLPGVSAQGALHALGISSGLNNANIQQLVSAANLVGEQAASAAKSSNNTRDLIALQRLEADLAYKTRMLEIRQQQANTQAERVAAQNELTKAQQQLAEVRAARAKAGDTSPSTANSTLPSGVFVAPSIPTPPGK